MELNQNTEEKGTSINNSQFGKRKTLYIVNFTPIRLLVFSISAVALILFIFVLGFHLGGSKPVHASNTANESIEALMRGAEESENMMTENSAADVPENNAVALNEYDSSSIIREGNTSADRYNEYTQNLASELDAINEDIKVKETAGQAPNSTYTPPQQLASVSPKKTTVSTSTSTTRVPYTRSSSENSIYFIQVAVGYDKDNTYFGLGTGMNFSMFLPYSILPYNFTKYFEPTIRWDTTYTLGYRFKEKYIDNDYGNSQFGEFNNHNFTTRFSMGGTGYSLFYLPDLNLNMETFITTGYDFIPTYNAEIKAYQVEFSTNKMLTTEVGASARLLYNQSYISYDVTRNLLGTNLTANRINAYFHFPIPLGKITDWILIKNNKKPFFDGIVNDFNLYFGFSFTHDFINYRYNTAAFTFGIELQVLKQWKFRIATTSANENAYRYIKSYAEKENQTWVNPFWDIIDSFNFSDSKKRTASLFKLKSIEASIWHELDGWQIQATFAVRPSTLPSDITSGSVKGVYWNKEFWIEFTLTDFPTVGLPKQDYDLNSTITDLRDNAVRTQ